MSRRSPANDEGQLFLFDIEEEEAKPEPKPGPKPRRGKARDLSPVAWVYALGHSRRLGIDAGAGPIIEAARRIPSEPYPDGIERVVVQLGLDEDPTREGYERIPTPYVTHGLQEAFAIFRRKGARLADFYLRRDPEEGDEEECARQIERGIAELRRALGSGVASGK